MMKNDQVEHDAGLMAVLLDRFDNQRLPAALALKEKVDSGGRLSDLDVSFLKEVSKDVIGIKSLLDRHPECNEIATGMMNLCSEIAKKGLANET